ncbi:hypothetical protein [Streptomyces sp. NPDC021224]|uniref:hypothetical protein n=1 Tax=unclassified Streptomyces TaxID=2593676 RepID=UPI00379A027A
MHLVHVELHRTGHALLPPGVAGLVLRLCGPDEPIEHVAVHPDAVTGPVLGLFVLAPSVAAAERLAATACRRALAALPEPTGFTVGRCGVRLVPQFYDQQLSPGPDGQDMSGPD